MKNNTNYFKVIILLLLTLLVCFAFTACSFVFNAVEVFSNPPPEPAVQYAEFPFNLVYELDGENIEVVDVYVCEYDGVAFTSNGWMRKWKGYVKSTGENDLFITSNEGKKIYFMVGLPAECMGDSSNKREWAETGLWHRTALEDYAYESEKTEDGYEWQRIISAEDLLSKYNVKFISFEHAAPIENTFE